ncbi:MAG: hypothetical protein Q9208_004410 [Pyrenodesmia sp. 3 TL-2023]
MDVSDPVLPEIAATVSAKNEFIAKWEKRTYDRTPLEKLCRFEILPHYENRRPQEPYRGLDKMMEIVSGFASLTTQQVFVSNLRLWMASDDRSLPSFDPPSYLNNLEKWKRESFEQLWKASHTSDFRHGKKEINGMLWRMSIVKEMNQYHNTIELLKKHRTTQGVELRNGQTAAAKTREQIYEVYETLYPHQREAAQKRSDCNRKQTRARPYVALQKNFGNEGIFALLPLSLSEGSIAGSPRITALLEALDVLRPDFRQGRLQIYSYVVNLLYMGRVPSDADVELLERWSRSDCHAMRLAAFQSNDTTLMERFELYPIDGAYESVEERENLSHMHPLLREEFLANRITSSKDRKERDG